MIAQVWLIVRSLGHSHRNGSVVTVNVQRTCGHAGTVQVTVLGTVRGACGRKEHEIQ